MLKPSRPVVPAAPAAPTAPGPDAALFKPVPPASTKTQTYLEVIAAVCHEANRVLTAHAGDVPVQPPWDEYPTELKQSLLNGIKFCIENPDVTPEQQHENWCAKKSADGWSHNGIYDAEAKRHPHLCAYGALAPEVRLKDKMFHVIVTAMLKLE